MNKNSTPLLLLILLWLTACTTATPTAVFTQVAVVEIKDVEETAVFPTNTPIPSVTPTHTPVPIIMLTETPTATPMPLPTITPPFTRIELAETENSGEIRLELINQVGGVITAVAVQDNLAYFGIGSRIAVADISDYTQLQIISWSSILPGIARQITIRDGLAYVALGQTGIWIFDITDSTNIQPVGHVQTISPSHHFLLQNNLIYTVDTASPLDTDIFMSVIDVTDPLEPVEISTLPTPAKVKKMVLVDNYLYISSYPQYVGYEKDLWVVDVSNPYDPRLVTSVPELAGRDMVEILGDRLLIAIGETLITADISNPESPVKIMQSPRLTDWGDIYFLHMQQGIAWGVAGLGDLNDCGGKLYALDISEFDNIRRISDFPVGCNRYDSLLIEGIPYLTNGSEIININDPVHPSSSHIENLSTIPWLRQLGFDDFLYGSDGNAIYIFDTENQVQPYLKSIYESAYSINDTSINESQLHLATYWEGIAAVDTTDQINPQETAVTYPEYHAENSYNLVFSNDRLYASLNGNLGIFDPITLQWIGGDGEDVYGNYGLFIVDNNTVWAWSSTSDGYGLLAMDVTNPEQLTQIGFFRHEWGSLPLELLIDQGILYTIMGDHCNYQTYFSCEDTVLTAIDISDISQIKLMATVPIPSSVQTMIKVNDQLMLIGDDLWLVDITNPAQPQINGSFSTPGYAQDAVIVDNLIYVADGSGGLLTLRMVEQP